MTGWLVPGTPPTIAPRQDALTLVWTTIRGSPDAPRAPIVQVSPRPIRICSPRLTPPRTARSSPTCGRATGSATRMTRPARPTWGCVRCCASGRRTPRKSPGCSRRRASTGTRSGKRADYRQRTIAAALAHCTNFYAPCARHERVSPTRHPPRPQGVVHTEEHAMSLPLVSITELDGTLRYDYGQDIAVRVKLHQRNGTPRCPVELLYHGEPVLDQGRPQRPPPYREPEQTCSTARKMWTGIPSSRWWRRPSPTRPRSQPCRSKPPRSPVPTCSPSRSPRNIRISTG